MSGAYCTVCAYPYAECHCPHNADLRDEIDHLRARVAELEAERVTPDDNCVCGDSRRVSPEGFTCRHRQDGPCYVQPHDGRFMAVWNAIKGWDIQRDVGAGRAGATGDDVCTILEALAEATP